MASVDDRDADKRLHLIAGELMLSANDKAAQNDEINRLMSVLKQALPRAEIELIGSIASGLNSLHSDVDVHVKSPPDSQVRVSQSDALAQFLAVANKSSSSSSASSGASASPAPKRPRHRTTAFYDAEQALKAAYPSGRVEAVQSQLALIKLTDKRFHVDISFDNSVAVRNTEWTRSMVAKYPLLPDLCRLVKRWAFLRGLPDGKMSGISSHGWCVMIIHALMRTNSGDSLLGSLRAFFHYYTHTFNYETGVVCVDPARINWTKQEWDQDSGEAPFLTTGRYPKSLAIVDAVETGRNLTKFLPPALLLLIQAEFRRADSQMAMPFVDKVFERVKHMENQVTEGWFYLALAPNDAEHPVQIVYCLTIFQGEEREAVASHLSACRWNAPNVQIAWKLYELSSALDSTAKKSTTAKPSFCPTDIMCTLSIPPQISPPWRTIQLNFDDIEHIQMLKSEVAVRLPSQFQINEDVIDEENERTPESQRMRKRAHRTH